MEEQPEAALMRSGGGEERRLATSARPGTLARKEAALGQDEGREEAGDRGVKGARSGTEVRCPG